MQNMSHASQRSKKNKKIKQYSLGMTINNQKRNLICRALTKTRWILHELISQIPLFRNYENRLLACSKSKETKDYLETKVELKLFERKLNL